MPEERARVVIEGDMTVRMVRSLLGGLPGTWRLVGQEDGSIVASPAVRRPRLVEEEDYDDDDVEEAPEEPEEDG